MVRGERGRRPIGTLFGSNPVAALTELLQKNHVRQVDVPLVSFVDDHRQDLSHGVVDTLDATVAAGMAGVRRGFPHVEGLVHGKRQLGAEFQPIIGEEICRTPPKSYVSVDQDVSCAFSRGFRCSSRRRACLRAAESIRKD